MDHESEVPASDTHFLQKLYLLNLPSLVKDEVRQMLIRLVNKDSWAFLSFLHVLSL